MLETGGVPRENISSWNRIRAGGFVTGSKQAKMPSSLSRQQQVPFSVQESSHVVALHRFLSQEPAPQHRRRKAKVHRIHRVWKCLLPGSPKSLSVQKAHFSFMKDIAPHTHTHIHKIRLTWESDLGFVWLTVVSHPSQQPIRSCTKFLNAGHLYLGLINEYGNHKHTNNKNKVGTVKGFWTYNNQS